MEQTRTYSRKSVSDRRQSDLGPPQGYDERRTQAERRCPKADYISFDTWAEAMSNYYCLYRRK